MSSLWALLKKKPSVAYDRKVFPAEVVPTIVSSELEAAPVLINATPLVVELKSRRCPLSPSYDLTPGFRSVWIEYINTYTDGTSGREAVSVMRMAPVMCKTGEPIPENAAHYLCFFLWDEAQGLARLRGAAHMMIDSLGDPIPDSGPVSWDADDVSGNQQFAIALETLTTMNTRGTRIEPPLEKHVQVVKPNRTPCSVWRTIHLPEMPSAPLDAETSDTMLERREHWVRAHRKDYRHGAGMFGRVKALVWVPEFQRGNPELGTVKQSYAVGR
jgi:hypothetical protein